MKSFISTLKKNIQSPKKKWFQKGKKYLRLFVVALIVNTVIFFFLPVLNLIGFRDDSKIQQGTAVKVFYIEPTEKKGSKKEEKNEV